MKIRNAVHRSFVIVTILLLSAAVGYVYSVLGHRSDLKEHPRDYSEYVEKYCAEYGIPEYIAYAVILEGSGFSSNYVSEDGRIGLMQLSDEMFEEVSSLLGENSEMGILYDPETNIRFGTYCLSHLYTEYSRWKNVYAAYITSTSTLDEWSEKENVTDENGNLITIPDSEVEKRVSAIEEAAELYKELYY